MFSLDEEVMARFRALVPDRQRSKVVESLLRQELDSRERAFEARLAEAAHLVETHPDFAEVRAVSDDVDGVAGEAVESVRISVASSSPS